MGWGKRWPTTVTVEREWIKALTDVAAAARAVDEIVEASPIVTTSLAAVGRYEAATRLRKALKRLDALASRIDA